MKEVICQVVFHEGGHLSGWCFMKEVICQAGVSQRRSSVRPVFHKGGHLSGWCFMKEVICQGGVL